MPNFVKEVQYLCNLKDEQRFIYNNGYFNCNILKAKRGDQIIAIMKEQMPDEVFSESQINFMNEISEKEVLVSWRYTFFDKADIFVYPEDNTPFSVECFI